MMSGQAVSLSRRRGNERMTGTARYQGTARYLDLPARLLLRGQAQAGDRHRALQFERGAARNIGCIRALQWTKQSCSLFREPPVRWCGELITRHYPIRHHGRLRR